MPFADKFRAMMGFPFAGDTVEGFYVESVAVSHTNDASGGYIYAVRMVLAGVGGQAGLRRALKALFASHPTTFSAYGNAYQLRFGKPAIESLGQGRYAVAVHGGGARVYLEDELRRFLAHLADEGHLAGALDAAAREALVEAYLGGYQAEITRQVNRYTSKLRRRERGHGSTRDLTG